MGVVQRTLVLALLVVSAHAINCYNCVGRRCKRNSQVCTASVSGAVMDAFCYTMEIRDISGRAKAL